MDIPREMVQELLDFMINPSKIYEKGERRFKIRDFLTRLLKKNQEEDVLNSSGRSGFNND